MRHEHRAPTPRRGWGPILIVGLLGALVSGVIHGEVMSQRREVLFELKRNARTSEECEEWSRSKPREASSSLGPLTLTRGTFREETIGWKVQWDRSEWTTQDYKEAILRSPDVCNARIGCGDF